MSTDEKVAKARDDWMELYLGRNIRACGSPIEELFLWALLKSPALAMLPLDLDRSHAAEVNAIPAVAPIVGEIYVSSVEIARGLIVQQMPIGKYRCDFAVLVRERGRSTLRVAIELDGHDFHERTKAQAKHDKSRDRALATAGWQVLRFTGSEVWEDAADCVCELWGFVTKVADQRRVG